MNRIMKQIEKLLCLLLLLGCGTAHAYFPSILPLVTGNDYAPFADKRLPNGGMISEIVTASFHAVGRQTHIAFLPWRRSFMGVERGLYSGTFPHFKTPELEERFYFSQPIYPLKQRIYVAAESSLSFGELNDLAGLRLCSPIGHVIHDSLQKLIYNAAISIISPSSTEICARMLERGRVDFMALDETVYQHQFSNARLKAVGKPLDNSELFLLFPKNSPDSLGLLWEFNAGLQTVKECGLFDEIIQRHLQGGGDWRCFPGERCK
jgi:polar amino acid transport system substrate-binding protein